MSDAVRYHRAETSHVGVITLSRPDNRSSMTPELLDAFADAARAARADEDARCLVVTGQGRCFSAGADFKSNIQRGEGAGRWQTPAEKSYAMYEPFLSLLDVEVPVLGALNGHAVGGGFGLALVCDVRVANRAAKYGANFARLGLASGMAISYLLPRLVGPAKAAELLFTGRLFLGDEAEAMGLVSRAVDADDVLPQTLAMAETIAANGPIAVRALKRLLYDGLGWDPKGAARREAWAQAMTVATADSKEGMRALLDKRAPAFEGR